MARVAISTLIVRPRQSGSNEPYLVGLLNGLRKLGADNEYVLFVTKENEELFSVVRGDDRFRFIRLPVWRKSRLLRIAMDQLLVPIWGRVLGAEVVHYPGTIGSALWMKRPRQVVTVHYDIDGDHSKSVSWARRIYYSVALRRARRSGQSIIVPSETFAGQLASHWGLSRERINVVHHGVTSSTGLSGEEELLERLGLKRGFVLCVTNSLPHKNALCSLRVYSDLLRSRNFEGQLALVGRIEPEVLDGWVDALVSEGVGIPRSRIVRAGILNQLEVGLLYRSAAVTLITSLAESSSMPLLEAMANGCPVVASDLPVHREIAGDGAVLVSCDRQKEIRNACVRVCEDLVFREDLIQRGLKRASAFSWESTARKTVAAYEETCQPGR